MNKKSRIVISDVHACYKTLLALVAKLPKDIPLTFAGDLIDRGPNSKAVIDFVKNGGHDCVVGNHEVMMMDELQFYKDEEGEYYQTETYYHGIWLMNGGDKALDSYQDDKGEVDVSKLKEHLEWIKTLPYYLEYPELKNDIGQHLLITHTTANQVWGKYKPDTHTFKNSVIWERTDVPSKIPGIYNIYGHTPQKNKATIKEHFACIDTGCYYKKGPYKKLTALQFPEMKLFTQENIEDEKT